jgi:endonuclease/exonuclease/phosphatase family metal-dependent hydrolase
MIRSMKMSRRLFIAAGSTLPLVRAGERTRYTVLSFNIHHGEGTDGRVDLERTARVIKSVSPDLVALQEVDRRTARSGGVDQLAELAKLTGLKPYFGKTLDFQGGEYGNGMLVRPPIREHQNIALPGSEPRGLLSVQLENGVLFAASHFDISRQGDPRLAAAERINQWLDAQGNAPAILAGDLNAVRSTPAIKKLQERWTIAGEELATFPAGEPVRQIDFVLFRPADKWRAIETRVLDEREASDHRPIVAVLEAV